MDQVRVKNALGISPYFLVYRKEPVFSLNVRILIFKFMTRYAKDANKVQIRLMNLLEMDEK